MLGDVLGEAQIRAAVPEKTFLRGDAYCEQGSVLSVARRGERIHAAVAGSEAEPYQVQVTARGDRVLASCDCPYAEEWGEWCKHIVAVLLALARGRTEVEEQPTVRELLAPLDRRRVEEVVEALVEETPHLYEVVRERARPSPRRPR